MNVLILYYSLTGQASAVALRAERALREQGAQVTCCRVDFADASIRPSRPFKFADVQRWSKLAAEEQLFDISIDPPNAFDARYDLILLLSNTWQQHPAPPIRSALAHPGFRQLMHDTPLALYVVSRRLWKRNAEVVQREAGAAGARWLGCWHFGHHGGPVSSLFTTFIYMLGSADRMAWPLPQYGLSDEAIARIAPTTQALLSKLQHEPQSGAAT